MASGNTVANEARTPGSVDAGENAPHRRGLLAHGPVSYEWFKISLNEWLSQAGIALFHVGLHQIADVVVARLQRARRFVMGTLSGFH